MFLSRNVPVVIVALYLGSGCSSSPAVKAPFPPAIPHGHVHDVVVHIQGLGDPEVAEQLAAALQSLPERHRCATVRAVTDHGYLLATATVAAVPNHDRITSYRVEDARTLLLCGLRSVRRWTQPVLLVSSDAAGTDVLASAAFVPYENNRFRESFQRPLRFGSQPPEVFLNISGVSPDDAEWMATKAVALFHFNLRQAAASPSE